MRSQPHSLKGARLPASAVQDSPRSRGKTAGCNRRFSIMILETARGRFSEDRILAPRARGHAAPGPDASTPLLPNCGNAAQGLSAQLV